MGFICLFFGHELYKSWSLDHYNEWQVKEKCYHCNHHDYYSLSYEEGLKQRKRIMESEEN